MDGTPGGWPCVLTSKVGLGGELPILLSATKYKLYVVPHSKF